MKKKDKKEVAEKDSGYSVSVVNIHYRRKSRTFIDCKIPEIVTLNIPEGIMRLKGDEQKFMDEIESFAYNCISRKYQIEVTNCQIFLPNEAA
jgi:hypothetical protein